MNRTAILAASLVCGAVGCSRANTSPSVSSEAALIVRNRRPDTVGFVREADCAATTVPQANLLASRERVLPQGDRAFAILMTSSEVCVDLEIGNAEDSVIDTRSHLLIHAGDSLIVVLRK
jgi:hypothetical protein